MGGKLNWPIGWPWMSSGNPIGSSGRLLEHSFILEPIVFAFHSYDVVLHNEFLHGREGMEILILESIYKSNQTNLSTECDHKVNHRKAKQLETESHREILVVQLQTKGLVFGV